MTYTENKLSKEVTPTSTFKKVIRKQAVIEEESVSLKVEEPTVRYMKLYSLFRHSRSKCLYKPEPKVVPELRLSGNWLEEAGFSIADYVCVTVLDGLLIIRPAEQE